VEQTVEQRTDGLRMRRATRQDVVRIVQMLADDAIGATREALADPLPQGYWDAFDAIDADPNQYLAVAEIDGSVVGCLQLTFQPGLTRLGMWRAIVEGVRVDSSRRGARIGETMMAWAIHEARRRRCGLIQLTTDKRRLDAHRFSVRMRVGAADNAPRPPQGRCTPRKDRPPRRRSVRAVIASPRC
jgi:GNAT superfamily N-acetyltransferase